MGKKNKNFWYLQRVFYSKILEKPSFTEKVSERSENTKEAATLLNGLYLRHDTRKQSDGKIRLQSGSKSKKMVRQRADQNRKRESSN